MSRRFAAIGVLMVLMSVLPAGADEKPAPKESALGTNFPTGDVRISDVIIQGNQRMSTEQIKARLHTQAGKKYDPAALDEDVREMYKTRQFSNIQPLTEQDGPDKVKFYFFIRDLPNKVQKVTFLGAKHIKPENLRKETGIHVDMPLNPKLNLEGCRKILDKYEEQGRSFATCELVKGGDWNDTEVVYQITEGPKVKVHDIQFTGNTFVSSARLATRIKSSPNWFHVLGGNYNSKMAEADIHELEKYFKDFGFRDVRVSLDTQRSADSSEVTLIFHIHEGERHSIQVSPQTNGQNTISLERPPARIGHIILTGNKRISSDSILDHLALRPGQILTYPDLKKAEKRLAELGLFVVDPATDVHPTVTVVASESDSAFKDILITVKEKKAKRASDEPE